MNAKRPCDQTLSWLHVFRERSGGAIACLCGVLANAEERAAWDAAVRQAAEEARLARVERERRGER